MTSQPGQLPACQILVPDTGGDYKVYSLLLLMQRLLRAISGTGMAPHHFITQRGPLQDGSTAVDMRWDEGILQLLIADWQCTKTEYFDKRGALVRLLRPNRSFNWDDGVVRPLIFRYWLPAGQIERGTDLELTAGSAIVTSLMGRFVERGLDPGCSITISGSIADDGTYTIVDVPNDYTLEISGAMTNTETAIHWEYMRRWGKRDLYCLLEQGPAFDEEDGPGPFAPIGFREALRFTSHDPLWYGQTQTETWSVSTYGALIFEPVTGVDVAWFGEVAGEGQWFFDATGTSNLIEVAYWGTVGAKPIITIRGPAENIIVRNVTMATEIDMDYTVASGEIVTIDTEAQTVTNDWGDNLQPYTTGDLATFELSPHPQAPNGVNEVQVSFSGADTNTELTMTWRNRYESLH